MDKKRSKHQRIKQIIFHFRDSSDFIIYDLDSEGKHKNIMQRAARTKTKKAKLLNSKLNNLSLSTHDDLSTCSQNNLPLSTQDDPSTCSQNNFSFSMQYDLSSSSIYNLPKNFASLQNFEFNYSPDSELYSKNYADHTESLCYPLITEPDKNQIMMNHIFDSDLNDLFIDADFASTSLDF